MENVEVEHTSSELNLSGERDKVFKVLHALENKYGSDTPLATVLEKLREEGIPKDIEINPDAGELDPDLPDVLDV
jgi:hypothetical protein